MEGGPMGLDTARLRPVERCVLRMSAAGLADAEIGRRLGRSPHTVGRIRSLAAVPRPDSPRGGAVWGGHATRLNPLERCVLRWRDRGAGHPEIAARLRRTSAFVGRVEQLVDYKLTR